MLITLCFEVWIFPRLQIHFDISKFIRFNMNTLSSFPFAIQLPQASLFAPWRLFATTAGLQDGIRPTKVGHWESASEERCGWPGRKKHQMDVRIKSVGRVELLVIYGNLVFKIFNMWIISDVCITLCWNGRVMYYPLLVLTIWQRYIVLGLIDTYTPLE